MAVAQMQQPNLAVDDPDDVAGLTQHPVWSEWVELVAAPLAGASYQEEPGLQSQRGDADPSTVVPQ